MNPHERLSRLSCDHCTSYKAVYQPRNGCASCWIYYLKTQLERRAPKKQRRNKHTT